MGKNRRGSIGMRGQKEILRLANTVKNEAQNLPEENDFGESNEGMIEELLERARQLYSAAGGHNDEIEDQDVVAWLNGDESELDVYEP